MAAADLIQLIDLSLGTQPCGVVNFNYLHGLLHEICRRLVQLESSQGGMTFSLPSLPEATGEETGGIVTERSNATKDTQTRESSAKERATDKKASGTVGLTKEDKESATNKDKESATKQDRGSSPKDEKASELSEKALQAGVSRDPTSSSSTGISTVTPPQADKLTPSNQLSQSSIPSQTSLPSVSQTNLPSQTNIRTQTSLPRQADGSTKMTTPPPPRETSTSSRHSGSSYVKSRTSFVGAANDLGALERKLQELEARVNTMESLPELLEKKSSDSQSTPASDVWHFTSFDKRINTNETGLDKAFKLIDDLLGELGSVKEQMDSLNSNVDNVEKKLNGSLKSLSSLEGKMGNLEELKLSAAKDSMGDAAAAMLSELASNTGRLETEIIAIKASLESLPPPDPNTVSREDLTKALSQREDILQRHESALKNHTESLSALETGLTETQGAVGDLDGRVSTLSDNLDTLKTTTQEVEAGLSGKVNVADLESLMPSGSDEGASFMPKLLELQAKLAQVESKLGSMDVPSDLLDKIDMMQKAIDSLQSQLSSLSSLLGSASEDRSKLEELGSVVAQLGERMSDIDRAVTALSQTVTQGSLREAKSEEEPDGAKKFVDSSSFEALQELLEQVNSEQERLIGTAAHLSHELDVSKEHVKTLYSNVDDLKETKADKDLLEVEVRGKADKNALDNKASRDWVDSTFERLDREIREAASKLSSQEEALKSAVNQLEGDVEGKLDRLELEPLKEYFDKKLERVKPAAPVYVPEAMGDEAAGFRKPLRFRCISCDKPLGLKQRGVIPALPSEGMFPDTRSFRPYTTYELELIRRHQRMGSPFSNPVFQGFSRTVRSAGGIHTMTRPHQRIRVTPLTQNYTPDSAYKTPPPAPARNTASPLVLDETDIIGQDGHIYKGRSTRNRLPPLSTMNKRGRQKMRPSTSPMPPSYT